MMYVLQCGLYLDILSIYYMKLRLTVFKQNKYAFVLERTPPENEDIWNM